MIELIEAEGRTFRRETIEVAFRVGVLLFGGLLALAGLGLVGWALYAYLATLMGAALAALVTGLIAIFIGGGLVWRIRRSYR